MWPPTERGHRRREPSRRDRHRRERDELLSTELAARPNTRDDADGRDSHATSACAAGGHAGDARTRALRGRGRVLSWQPTRAGRVARARPQRLDGLAERTPGPAVGQDGPARRESRPGRGPLGAMTSCGLTAARRPGGAVERVRWPDCTEARRRAGPPAHGISARGPCRPGGLRRVVAPRVSSATAPAVVVVGEAGHPASAPRRGTGPRARAGTARRCPPSTTRWISTYDGGRLSWRTTLVGRRSVTRAASSRSHSRLNLNVPRRAARRPAR